jgi:hypothetical protein
MRKYRFWSDTNKKQFEWELQRMGIPSEHDRENGYTVVVPEGYDEQQLDPLATGVGATIVFEEKEKADDGTGTSGLESSGFLDTGAVSARAHDGPDDAGVFQDRYRISGRRDAPPEQRSSRPVGPFGHVLRRKTRSQDGRDGD